MSANVAHANDSGEQLPPRVAAALAAAEIPPSKLGPARRARLTAPEQALYFWILRRFASEGRPHSADTRDEARRLGLDDEVAFATLAREDLVHLGADGEISVAYPFSGRPTAHRVRFVSGHQAYAMCAIDALGIAPMFGEQIEIVSRDPVSGGEIRARRRRRRCRVAARLGGCGRWRARSPVRLVPRLLPGAELLHLGRERGALALRAPAGAGRRDLDGRGGPPPVTPSSATCSRKADAHIDRPPSIAAGRWSPIATTPSET